MLKLDLRQISVQPSLLRQSQCRQLDVSPYSGTH